MTFDPTFAFYRDVRHLNLDPPEEFWTEIRDETRRTFEDRRASYPSRVAKGRISRQEADHELRVARSLAEGWLGIPRSPNAPLATTVEELHALRREITLRRQRWPRLVELRRMTAEEMDRRILLLEICHDVMWHGSSVPEVQAARAELARFRHQQAALKRAD